MFNKIFGVTFSIFGLRFARFTDRSRKIMSMAKRLAVQLNCDHVGTEHVLLGLVKSDFGRGMYVLVKLGARPSVIENELSKLMKQDDAQSHRKMQSVGSSTKKVINFAIDEARDLVYSYVGTEHIVLALLRENDFVAAKVLNKLGVTYEKARELVRQLKDVKELKVELNSSGNGNHKANP